jgi:hypothetical protein
VEQINDSCKEADQDYTEGNSTTEISVLTGWVEMCGRTLSYNIVTHFGLLLEWLVSTSPVDSCLLAMSDFSISYPAVCFLESNGRSTPHPQ